jgi:hypothetical protein
LKKKGIYMVQYMNNNFAEPVRYGSEMGHITAPAFGTSGGAIQYYHDLCIMEMLGTILERIEEDA